ADRPQEHYEHNPAGTRTEGAAVPRRGPPRTAPPRQRHMCERQDIAEDDNEPGKELLRHDAEGYAPWGSWRQLLRPSSRSSPSSCSGMARHGSAGSGTPG